MKNKDKRMTIEEHLQNAKDLSVAMNSLYMLFNRCQKHYPNSGRLMRSLRRIHPLISGSVFTQIKSDLDEEWHRLITDEQFKQYGHIYYGQIQLKNKAIKILKQFI